jgi:hypothetical protein
VLEDNIKEYIEEVCWYVIGRIISPSSISCQHVAETCAFIKWEDLLYHWLNYSLLKKYVFPKGKGIPVHG